MLEELREEYPEATPYIQQAVEEHGEEWVIENYYPKIYQLGIVMDIPDVEELPFYDEDTHDVPTESERIAMAEAMNEYRRNLRTGRKPGDE
jgi:hypothetical protein